MHGVGGQVYGNASPPHANTRTVYQQTLKKCVGKKALQGMMLYMFKRTIVEYICSNDVSS